VPILEKFGAALENYYRVELAKADTLEEIRAAKDHAAAGLFEKLTGEAVAAAPDKAFENSLGMKFVPVPIVGGPTAGKTIRFCIREKLTHGWLGRSSRMWLIGNGATCPSAAT